MPFLYRTLSFLIGLNLNLIQFNLIQFNLIQFNLIQFDAYNLHIWEALSWHNSAEKTF